LEHFFKHPWVIVAVIAAVTVFFAAQLPKAGMNNNLNSFLPNDLPERVIARHFEEEYGDKIMMLVGLKRPYGTVFDGAFLSRIREFTAALEDIPLVYDTNSIMSSRYITSDSESIMVTDLVGEEFSGTAAEIAELKRRLDSWDLYQGFLVSDDFSSTQIAVTLDAVSDEAGNPEVVASLVRIREVAQEKFSGFAEVYTAGESVVAAAITETALADVVFLVPLVLLVLLVVMVFSFRRVSFVALPLLSVAVVIIWTIGIMPLFNVQLTILSIMMPVITGAVGSAYAIHIVSHYKDEVSGKTSIVEEHRVLVLSLTRKLRKPVFLAALTTFAGFISFCFCPFTPMRDFGLFASFGVIASVAVSITLVPAILLIRGPRAVKLAARKKGLDKKYAFNFEEKLADTLTAIAKKRTLVLALTAAVITGSLIGASKLIVDTSVVEFFNENTEVSRSDRFIREQFGGSSRLIVSVEADNTQTLLSPEVLGAADGLAAYLSERVPEVGKVTGFTDMVKRMNQMFNVDESPERIRGAAQTESYQGEDGGFGFGEFGDFGFSAGVEETQDSGQENTLPVLDAALPLPASSNTPLTFAMLNAAASKRSGMSADELVRELERMANYEGYAYYEIPADPARYGKQTSEELGQLVSNYLVLLAGDQDGSMANDPLEPTAIQTVIRINSQWQDDVQKVINAVNDYVDANFPKTVTVFTGGEPAEKMALSRLVMNAQVVSIFVSVLIVLLTVALSNKSLAAGLIAALPMSIAVMGNFAVMGFFGITLNLVTALIASLTVGIGIDYTIHFIEAFKREYKAGGDYLQRTFATSGKAILINAASVGAGFCVVAFSQFRVTAQLGGLIALSMAVSAVFSLTVIPALITLVKPKFIYGQDGALR
jgi:predicted RND superfamily exporter protein